MIDDKTQKKDHNNIPSSKYFHENFVVLSPPSKHKRCHGSLFLFRWWSKITVCLYYLSVHKLLCGGKKVRERNIQSNSGKHFFHISSYNTPKFRKFLQNTYVFCVFFFFFLLTTVLDMWFKIIVLVRRHKFYGRS